MKANFETNEFLMVVKEIKVMRFKGWGYESTFSRVQLVQPHRKPVLLLAVA